MLHVSPCNNDPITCVYGVSFAKQHIFAGRFLEANCLRLIILIRVRRAQRPRACSFVGTRARTLGAWVADHHPKIPMFYFADAMCNNETTSSASEMRYIRGGVR